MAKPRLPDPTEQPSDHPVRPADAPARIGPYVILGVLGEGGMGTVYLAEQREPVQRRVALKVIKLGMDSKAVLARFDAERQAVSMMEHSCIARIFEAGVTASGQPYFAMEYVKGIPITRYCDQNRLSLPDRIELFRKVCSGVQHAHLKGVMHRDLKPTNILVTLLDGKPVPKIIDFGLAKAIDHRLVQSTIFTELGQVIGTPEYMSPEQAGLEALDVDSRTDIYSLGVLLYELLTGSLPFTREELQAAGWMEMQRVIRETDPPKPSTRITTLGNAALEHARQRGLDRGGLRKRLRGDLDWIVLKAIEKDRSRRYETALELAADLERHLQDLPVLASPPTLGYRMRKFARRYRGQVIAAALLLLSLAAGLFATTWFWLDARAQMRIAEKEATTARAQEKLAGERAVEAEAARKAKDAALLASETALRRESGLRLVAEGLLRSGEDPGLGVALVMAGGERSPGSEAESALRTTLAITREMATVQMWEPLPRTDVCVATPDLGTVAARTGEGRGLTVWSAGGARVAVAASEGSGPRYLAPVLSRDGRFCASAGGSVVRVHRTDTGALVRERTLGTRVATAIAFGGATVLVGTQEGTLDAIAIGGAQDRTLLDGGEAIFVLRCAVALPRVLVGRGEQWEVHDFAAGQKVASFPGPTAPFMAGGEITADGTRAVAWGGRGGLVVWDARGSENVNDPSQRVLTPTNSWAIDEAGRRLALGCDLGVIKFVDLEERRMVRTLEGHEATALAFAADGSKLAAGLANGTILVCDYADWDQRTILRRHGGPVRHLCFLPGNELLSAGDDGALRRWSLGDPVGRRTPVAAELHRLLDVFSPHDGSVFELTKGVAPNRQLWPPRVFKELSLILSTCDPVVRIRGMRWPLTFASDGRHAVAWVEGRDRHATLFEYPSQKKVRELSIHAPSFAPDGQSIVGTTDQEELAIVATAGSGPPTVLADSGDHVAPVFRADGRQVIALHRDVARGWLPKAQARIWEAASGRIAATLDSGGEFLVAAALSPDGVHAVAGGMDGTVIVWHLGTGKRTLLTGHGGMVHALAFAADGDLMASGGDDGAVRLWDLAAAREVGRIAPDGSAVLATAFTQDGKWILYGTVAGSVAAEPVDPFAFAKQRSLRTLTPAERARFAVGTVEEQASANAAWRQAAGLPEPK